LRLKESVCHGLAALILTASAARTFAVEPPKFDREKLAAIAPAMQHFVDEGQLTGAVMAIGTADGLVYHEAIGKQSLDSDRPMAKDAMFRIKSMTKPITALAIMMLVDEGKLAIDDPLEKYLPEFKGQMLVATKDDATVTLKKPSRPITLRDLLTHTSGLPEYPKGMAEKGGLRRHTLAEAVAALSQCPLDYEPGSKWKYCSTGIDTLGRIIEVASGQPYDQFMSERIFEPLAMHDTTFFPSAEQRSRIAQLCAIKNGKLVSAEDQAPLPKEKPKFLEPSGGLYSTAADLAKLYPLFLSGGKIGHRRLVSEASLKEMTRIQTGNLECGFSPGMSFGLGVGVVREPQDITSMLSPGTFGHGGAYGTQGWIDPTRGMFVILLIQRTGLQPNGDRSDLRREFQTLAVNSIKAE
jgi:CubicO group peptidase (beta-lactamase class C family)